MNMAERTRKSGQVRMVAEVGLNPEQARRVSSDFVIIHHFFF